MRSFCDRFGMSWDIQLPIVRTPPDRATLRLSCRGCQYLRSNLRKETKRKRHRPRQAAASNCVAMNDERVLAELRRLEIETPSWGYGNSGTRFHVYPWPGAARSVRERIADAALVHRLTGCCPSVALHIPWDAVEDYAGLRDYAAERGLRIGAINPNL